jgi:DNA-binding response OmpR family regulator
VKGIELTVLFILVEYGLSQKVLKSLLMDGKRRNCMKSHLPKQNTLAIQDNGISILIAEDELDIRNLIKLTLTKAGYTVFATNDGLEALAVFNKQPINLAILDVMMPKLDGFNLLRKIRETSNIPVMFLTARGEEIDKVMGLGVGADDYMVKPFGTSELIARVSAQLRRHNEYSAKNHDNTKIEIGNLVLDNDSCVLYKDGYVIELNAKEYKLLHHFMSAPEKVFTKKQLYRAVWDDEFYYDDNTIMVHISHLRNKIEMDSKNPKYIKTIRGIGYKFSKSGEPNEK